MAQFLSALAPLELLIEILELSETPADVLNSALTCRRMRDAWSTGQAGLRVTWTLLQRDILAAELALITVRASKLTAGELANRQLSHTKVPLSELGSDSRGPNGSELKAVRRLHTLVVSFETRFYRNSYFYHGSDSQTNNPPEAAEFKDQWTCSLHRGLYRSFIVSVNLLSVYFEPYLATAASTEPEIQQLGDVDAPSEAQWAFLRRFAPYNHKLDADADHAAFGRLADTELRAHMKQIFDLTMGRAKSCDGRRRLHLECEDEDELALETGPCPVQLSGYSHADAHSVALEVMQMLWASGNKKTRLLFDHEDPDTELSVGSNGSFTPGLCKEENIPCNDDAVSIGLAATYWPRL
ncbi:hypothetical protein VHEMI10603 [[Torrubiella] hemipterigena]|uniref:F-box domain-containing protein n=1 Tax=[Torrubiella] hemipterigena TaxID=1531966 RepID=A0A0A1TDI7_9HYPO|nr:hypothetical protein VHEMI10603 [[Torrubiella] hemipterigena]